MLGVAFGALAAANSAMAADVRWTGAYVGANVGYSWGNANGSVSDTGVSGFGLPATVPVALTPEGAVGGGQIGYNWQINNSWVFGLETDFQGSAEKSNSRRSDPFSFVPGGEGATITGVLNQSVEAKILWFGTVRGRAGVLLGDSLLFYATGGLAYGATNANGSGVATGDLAGTTYAFNATQVKAGWTAGAGVEGVIPSCNQLTWKVEYLYVDLGSQSGSGVDPVFGATYAWNAKFTDNIVRIGVNYHFR
jgi:outer membrane immunogenic protein